MMCIFFALQCYLFHMYVGVRAGGGIGDEIEDPAGDEYELYRVVFDITFFFFVIVILLAIIQGKDNASLGNTFPNVLSLENKTEAPRGTWRKNVVIVFLSYFFHLGKLAVSRKLLFF